jgi:hypothetical protein
MNRKVVSFHLPSADQFSVAVDRRSPVDLRYGARHRTVIGMASGTRARPEAARRTGRLTRDRKKARSAHATTRSNHRPNDEHVALKGVKWDHADSYVLVLLVVC